ncbi:MAG: B12-binding domain-containing radical SAM protein, partial [Coriobacteriia bacterium]|nr:B12-binding domain-containing radical SAM protein [Coriobacteriia bacterium]
RAAVGEGWHRSKLYFIIGLPTETLDDVRGIGDLVVKVLAAARDSVAPNQRSSVKVGVSVSTFVPKAHTPFQWDGQLTLEEVRERQALLREVIPRKGCDLHWHDADVSFLEGGLARGGREMARVIERVWRTGGTFDAWTEEFSLRRWLDAFEAEGLDPVALATHPRDPEAALPWDHISAGISRRYLVEERRRGMAGEVTPDCSFTGCTACGVCTDLGVDIVLGGASRG